VAFSAEMNITISAEEEEVWRWRQEAVREKKRFSAWVRERLNARKMQEARKPEVREEVKQEVPKNPINPKGVEVSLMEPVNTAEEAGAKLKRLKEAQQAMEKRYGTK
jgi:hypothetical protein